MPDDRVELLALIVDYGGVLASPLLPETVLAWGEIDGVDLVEFERVLKEWVAPSYGQQAAGHPVHALERGEMAISDFERELARQLRTRDGRAVPAAGLLTRMLAGFQQEPRMVEAVRSVRRRGVRTALLSNSWGLDYPREDWPELFDVVVISGEVGMRKPEPGIFRHTARLLGVEPGRCVFVDDLPPNVAAASEVGMVAVQHVTTGQTLGELETLFGVPLRFADPAS